MIPKSILLIFSLAILGTQLLAQVPEKYYVDQAGDTIYDSQITRLKLTVSGLIQFDSKGLSKTTQHEYTHFTYYTTVNNKIVLRSGFDLKKKTTEQIGFEVNDIVYDSVYKLPDTTIIDRKHVLDNFR